MNTNVHKVRRRKIEALSFPENALKSCETTVTNPIHRSPTRKDVVLSLHNLDYKQTMLQEFREFEVSREKVADAGKMILSRLKAQLIDRTGIEPVARTSRTG